MSENRLRNLCAEWQKVLRLQDWDVRVKIVRHFAFPGGARAGRMFESCRVHQVLQNQ